MKPELVNSRSFECDTWNRVS